MHILLLLAFTFTYIQAVSFSDLIREQWKEYKLTYKREYNNSTEETYRMKIFMENYLSIVKHNQLYEQKLVSYKQKLNKFADMSNSEFVKTFNGYNSSIGNNNANYSNESYKFTYIPPANVELPEQVDWRDSGAVTPVKDQGQCGSCWAFSATGSLEGQHFRKTGKLISLSEQNLVDCSRSWGNYGCQGGYTDYAFSYVIANHGLDTEDSYSYEAANDKCRYNPKNSGVNEALYCVIFPGQYPESQLKSAVGTVGPISVAIDASHNSFRFYSEGVYYEPRCGKSSWYLDHAVLAVGYGTDDNGHDYWLVKNSWGVGWGDSGYIKMARNKNNNCGIATDATYPMDVTEH